eukprot:1713536-Alexandrium_andersonii.AAC.1
MHAAQKQPTASQRASQRASQHQRTHASTQAGTHTRVRIIGLLVLGFLDPWILGFLAGGASPWAVRSVLAVCSW